MRFVLKENMSSWLREREVWLCGHGWPLWNQKKKKKEQIINTRPQLKNKARNHTIAAFFAVEPFSALFGPHPENPSVPSWPNR